MDDGRIGHSELHIAGAVFFMADEFPEIGVVSPESQEGSSVSFVVYVPDVDAAFERAVARGRSSSGRWRTASTARGPAGSATRSATGGTSGPRRTSRPARCAPTPSTSASGRPCRARTRCGARAARLLHARHHRRRHQRDVLRRPLRLAVRRAALATSRRRTRPAASIPPPSPCRLLPGDRHRRRFAARVRELGGTVSATDDSSPSGRNATCTDPAGVPSCSGNLPPATDRCSGVRIPPVRRVRTPKPVWKGSGTAGPSVTGMAVDLDDDVTALARRIAELGAGERAKVFRMSWWSERMLDWAMARPAFKTQLFRFVDVFPATDGDDDVAAPPRRVLRGRRGARRSSTSGSTWPTTCRSAERSRPASPAGTSRAWPSSSSSAQTPARGGRRASHDLWRQGSAFTVDLLGEKTIVEAEADRYAARVHELLDASCDAAPTRGRPTTTSSATTSARSRGSTSASSPPPSPPTTSR